MTLPETLVLLAAFAQAMLTLLVIVRMGRARIAAMKAHGLTVPDVAMGRADWPDDVRRIENNVRNQFETPVLFYAAIGIALALKAAGWVFALGALVYLVSRAAHMVIHTGANILRKRFNAYLVGLAGLIAMWLSLLIGALA